MKNKDNENEIGYQFNAIPLNLMACCDLNCRSMLWTLVQLSSYYADSDGLERHGGLTLWGTRDLTLMAK